MDVTLSLYGAFRDYQPDPSVVLELADDARVGDLRAALEAHGRRHWSGFRPALLQVSAFASETDVLRDSDPLPADRRLAILPPVSGG
jgi:sulfur-carrier protein